MDWKNIASKYPKSFTEFLNHFKYDEQLFGLDQNNTPDARNLFDFFDHKGLYVYIRPEFYTTGINWNWQILWYLPKENWKQPTVGEDDFIGGTSLYGDNNEYPERDKAEAGAFEKAFMILEKRIDIHETIN